MKLTGKTFFLMVLTIALLALTLFLGFFGLQGFSRASGTELIDFTGMKKAEAEAWRTERKLAENQFVYSYVYDEEAAEDIILSQDRKKGTVLGKDETVVFTVSGGKDPQKEMELPDFTSMNRSEIEAWAEENGFLNLYIAFQTDESVPRDGFLASDPVSGTAVRRNQKIVVTVSSGTREEQQSVSSITVPDFSSYSQTNIQAWGSTNRISVNIQKQASDTVEKDRLISQSPKAGTALSPGESVTVTLSLGKAAAVQSFAGKTKAEAEQWVLSNNLRGIFLDVYHGTAKSGSIVSQDPSSGVIPQGGTICFEVSAGPILLSDYTGRTKSEFEAYILDLNTRNQKSANLSVSVQERESEEEKGILLSQSQIGETAPGSTVAITVSAGKMVQAVNKAGMEESDFRDYLTSLGLKPGNISYGFHDSISQGKIIRNDTGLFSKGSSISYTVSRGSFQWEYESLLEPGVLWSDFYSASSEARVNGWSLSKSDEESETFEQGEIIACSVKGKAISCKVSSGKVILVPDVVGKEINEALSLLKEAGLKPSEYESSDYREEPKGTVIGQSLAKGSKVSEGSAIALTVSKGPRPAETISLPRFNIGFWDGQSEEKIRADMTRIYSNAGFGNLRFTVKDTSSLDNMNGIERITPAPDGSPADPDSEIQIVILAGRAS